jgi:hypothetical protein
MTAEEIEALAAAVAAAVKGAIETAQPLPPKKLFTAREASEITGLPVSFFEDGSAAGHLPSRKVGLRYRRYSEPDLDFLVEASGVAPTSGPLLERWRAKQRAALKPHVRT